MPEQTHLENAAAQGTAEVSPEQLQLLNEPTVPEVQYCLFRAGRERFCLPVLDIEEVVEWPTVTPVPRAPTFLQGIFNLRGNIIPIIDIAFTEGHRADVAPKHVVVARLRAEGDLGELRLGIASDEVIGTHSTADPLLVDEAPKDVPHCCGMLRIDERLALALDLNKVLESFPVPVI
ncbi:MAG TPA: chemotaxis protein CheW [Terriglobales bacterium]|nr:chemotaxis protein CheW [Terriglobales bacterium]